MKGRQTMNTTRIEQMAQALSPVMTLAPLGVSGRYERIASELREWLDGPARDEEWAYTVQTALVGITALLRRDFSTADAAFDSVIAQCA
jgi:hypothetical protein